MIFRLKKIHKSLFTALNTHTLTDKKIRKNKFILISQQFQSQKQYTKLYYYAKHLYLSVFPDIF
jgi:hypothetical protein